jgi:ABC-type transport system involved in multi-copper enzyme maturation permease subunit
METNSNLSKEVKIFGMNVSGTAQAILWAALVGGTLDAAAGVIVYLIYFGMNPLQVLQYIASGVFGPSVINGSFVYVLAGLVLHYLIAIVVAIIYFGAASSIKLFVTQKVVVGLLFGLGIWLVMNLVVLPNSNIPKNPFNAILAAIEIIWHMILVGLPIALIVAKHYEVKK